MRTTREQVVIAALVKKLGGEVHISMDEYEDAARLDLYQLAHPSFVLASAYKVVGQEGAPCSM
jgi:hypothetical protein